MKIPERRVSRSGIFMQFLMILKYKEYLFMDMKMKHIYNGNKGKGETEKMRQALHKSYQKWLVFWAMFLLGLMMMSIVARAGGVTVSPGANITWNLNRETKTLTLTGSGAMNDADASNGTSFDWYGLGDSIEKIVVGEGITRIGNEAFRWANKAVSISIPSTVTSIGDGAFENCTSLTGVTLPSGLKSIGKKAFENCEALKGINIPYGVTSIGEAAFYNCKALKSVTIPGTVTSIGANAFEKCTALESISIPGSVVSIGDLAFYGCASLKTATLFEGLKNIGKYAFYGCKLTAVSFPSSMQSIGSCAFFWSSTLKTIYFTGSRPVIAEDAFSGVRATVYYPSSWKTVPALKSDYMTWKVNSKASGAASPQLKTGAVIKDTKTNASYKVTGKNTVTYVKPTKKKATVSIPSSVTLKGVKCTVTVIADNAFKNNTKLKTVTIPSTIGKIGKNAFYNCKNLKKITIKTKKLTKKNVGTNAFKKTNAKATVKVPASKLKAYKTLLRSKGLGKKAAVKK